MQRFKASICYCKALLASIVVLGKVLHVKEVCLEPLISRHLVTVWEMLKTMSECKVTLWIGCSEACSDVQLSNLELLTGVPLSLVTAGSIATISSRMSSAGPAIRGLDLIRNVRNEGSLRSSATDSHVDT